MPTEKTIEERLIELENQLAEAQAALAEQLAKIERLKPLAEQGEQYRTDLIEQCISEGIRANGDDFPADAYREILRGTSLENIKAMLAQYAAQARKRFPGGRQTVDGDELEADADNEQPKQQRNGLPDSAYAA